MSLNKDGIMVILSSPSGAGKTTLVKLLSETKNYNISISHTTRKPRSNEVNGKDYFFVSKKDFNGLVIQIAWRGIEWFEESDQVTVSCGENWHDFVIYCLNKRLHGIENLALIPGIVGAAPIQNIGAYGVELSEFIYEVKALDKRTGEIIKYIGRFDSL